MVNVAALKRIAEYITRTFRVQVVFSKEADTAYTDLKTRIITIPTFIPDELSDAVTGLLDHEAEHLLATASGEMPEGIYQSSVFDVLNALEDIRINEILNKQYRNYINLISHFFALVYKEPKEWQDILDADKADGITAGQRFMSLIFLGNGCRGLTPPPGFYDAFLAEKDFWDDIIAQTKAATSVGGLMGNTVDMKSDEFKKSLLMTAYNKLYPDGPPKPKPPKRPGKEPGKEPGKDDKPGKKDEKKPGQERQGDGKFSGEELDILDGIEKKIREADKANGVERI